MTRFKILLIAGDTAELVADIPPPGTVDGVPVPGLRADYTNPLQVPVAKLLADTGWPVEWLPGWWWPGPRTGSAPKPVNLGNPVDVYPPDT